VSWRLALAAVVLAVVGLWLTIMRSGPEHRQIPADFRVSDFEAKEPSVDELEALRASIEKAARKRSKDKKNQVLATDAGSEKTPKYDAGIYESWVDNELLRRAETGESIPSDGSFDPSEALDRLKAGESREEVLGKPKDHE
jgi:hypothetical protein